LFLFSRMAFAALRSERSIISSAVGMVGIVSNSTIVQPNLYI
jgi:hypothetical protein